MLKKEDFQNLIKKLSNLVVKDFIEFLNNECEFLNKSEKQNENEEKSQSQMSTLAFILALTFRTLRRTII
jgi:hypothetical protein